MWEEGRIGDIHWMAKVYDEGSKYGINNGRISKLLMRRKGETLCNYDRGWDIKPTCQEAEKVLARLLRKFA